MKIRFTGKSSKQPPSDFNQTSTNPEDKLNPASIDPQNKNNLAKLAFNLSDIAYETSDEIRNEKLIQLGANSIASFSDMKKNRTHGYACIIENKAWLFFRGTDGSNDFLVDLNCISKNGVHRGFLSDWKKLEPQVTNWLNENGSDQTTFALTGHSLGAAIAILCARHIHTTYPGMISDIITFGAPPVFYSSVAEDFGRLKLPDEPFSESLQYRCKRYVNQSDFITWLPCLVGLKHVGEEYRIGNDGVWARFISLLKKIDHKLGIKKSPPPLSYIANTNPDLLLKSNNLPRSLSEESAFQYKSNNTGNNFDQKNNVIPDLEKTPLSQVIRQSTIGKMLLNGHFIVTILSYISFSILASIAIIVIGFNVVLSLIFAKESFQNHFRIQYEKFIANEKEVKKLP